MKWIRKGEEPTSFREWKASGNDDWAPTWVDLRDPQKSALRARLIDDQGGLCCYCCARIENDRRSCHLEHLQPRSRASDLELDFGNLLVSCGSSLRPAPERHCGEAKADWFDAEHFVSPLDPTSEGRFAFTPAGEIRSRDESARITIERLNLQCRGLVARREAAISGWLSDLDNLPVEDLRTLLSALDQRDAAGLYEAFQPAIAHTLRSLLQEDRKP